MAKRFRIYVLVMLLGGEFAAAAFAGGLSLLSHVGYLPPPALSNRISFDKKLSFIRQRGPLAPTVLAVGSSQTLNHFDGAALRDLYGPEVRPFNGAANGIGPDKLGYLIEFYLSSFASVEHVITITSLPDFDECTVGNSFSFDHEDATNYAFRGASAFLAYVEYFDPFGLLHTAFFRPRDILAQPYVDEFGAVEKRPEQKVRPAPYLHKIDDNCFANLRDVANMLAARGVAFTVVLTPLKPAYVAEFDPEGTLRDQFFGGVEKALMDTGARLFNANEEMAFSDEDFWDSTHLYWDAASRLSDEVALRVGPDGRGPPAMDNVATDAPLATNTAGSEASRN